MIVKFLKLKTEAIVPSYAHATDAGMDLFSIEKFNLQPMERHVFGIGIASEIPEGYFIKFESKSGLASKAGICVLGGVIDSGYRGEWGVILINLSNEPHEFNVGDKIAQAILHKIDQPETLEVKELSETDRGQKGFGSTGK